MPAVNQIAKRILGLGVDFDCASKIPRSVFVPAELQEGLAAALEAFGVIGIDRDHLIIGRDRLVMTLQYSKQQCPIEDRFDMVGFKCQSFVAACQSGLMKAELRQNRRAPGQGLNIVGFDGEHGIEIRQCLFKPVELKIRNPAPVEKVRICFLQSDSTLESTVRVFVPLELEERACEIRNKVGISGFEVDRTGQELDAGLNAAQLDFGNTQIVQRAAVSGISVDERLVEIDRRSQIPGLMQRKGVSQRFLVVASPFDHC